MSNRFTAVGAISIVLWGCVIPLVRLAIEDIGLYSSIAGIQGFAGLSGLAILWWRKQLPSTGAPYRTSAFATRLVLFVLHIFLLYVAVSSISREGLPAVIFCNYLWPSLVLIYSIPIARVRVPNPVLMGLGIAIVVIALMLEFGFRGFAQLSALGGYAAILYAILGANAWGAYSAITRRDGQSSGGSGVVPVFQLISAGIAALMSFQSTQPGQVTLSLFSWPIIIAGILNFIAYLCWDIGVRKGNVVSLSLLADFIPWLSLAATSLVLGVTIDPMTKASAGILVVGALTARLGTIERARAG